VAGAEGVSNDVLAERIEGVRKDVSELAEEQKRARTRLHNLEGFAAAYLDTQRANRRSEERQYRRLELRLQVLTVVIAVAAVAATVIQLIATGK
jgi:hypothetical protein